MVFHENCLPADDSHEISYLIFFENWGRCCKFIVSAAVVIGALRVKRTVLVSQHMFWVRKKKKKKIFLNTHSISACWVIFHYNFLRLLFSKLAFRNTIRGIQIRTDVLLVLVWIQTDCKGYLYISETTKVTASKERVKCPGRQTF